MFCNRPRTANSTPITLLHPVFGQFVADSKNHPLDPEIACFALELATAMCKFYKSESERAQAFRDLILEQLGIELKAARVEGTEFSTDGHAFVGFHVSLLIRASSLPYAIITTQIFGWQKSEKFQISVLTSLLFWYEFLRSNTCLIDSDVL
jgi:hypothetical protein